MTDQPFQCLRCNSRKHESRGLCENHYNKFRILVRNGETTWTDLVAMNLAGPSQSELKTSREAKAQ